MKSLFYSTGCRLTTKDYRPCCPTYPLPLSI